MRWTRGVLDRCWRSIAAPHSRSMSVWPKSPLRADSARSGAPSFILLWRGAVRITGLILFSAFLLSGASGDKHLSVYSVAANYSLPVVQREGRDYIGLLELLEPLGKVTAKTDGSRWRLRYNNAQAEFQVNKTRARVQDREADLGGRFLMENG